MTQGTKVRPYNDRKAKAQRTVFPYVPGKGRVGEPGPQRNPELFTDDEILAEAKHLIGLNMREGSNTLRTLAYRKLLTVLAGRRELVAS